MNQTHALSIRRHLAKGLSLGLALTVNGCFLFGENTPSDTDRCDEVSCAAGESCTDGQCIAPTPPKCQDYLCPADSSCALDQANEPGCYCDPGYKVNASLDGCEPSQLDACDGVSCPSNASCQVDSNNQAGCVCDAGYKVNLEGTACVLDEPGPGPTGQAIFYTYKQLVGSKLYQWYIDDVHVNNTTGGYLSKTYIPTCSEYYGTTHTALAVGQHTYRFTTGGGITTIASGSFWVDANQCTAVNID